jgi:hypothetical protein
VAGLDAEALQYTRQRTEPGKGGLQQIGADECREPKPLRIDEMGKQKAEEHHTTRESQYPAIDTHWHALVVVGVKLSSLYK